MRSYLIDEIAPSDMEKIKGFLQENTMPSELDSLYWVRLPRDLLSSLQYQHSDCGPHVIGVELGKDWIKLEFFVRSLKVMRCECQDYCTSQQISFITNFAHDILEDLQIKT